MTAKEPLSVTHPELAKQAHGWDPSTLTAGSHQIKEWICELGHTWNTAVKHRSSGSGCAICSGRKVLAGYNDLGTLNPELAKQAHGWDAKTVTPGSEKRREWICNYGHIWSSTIYARTYGSNCPFCTGRKVLQGFNDLATVEPELAKQAHGWDARTVTRSANLQKMWACDLGHIWSAVVASRSSGNGCPFCSGNQVLQGFNDLATVERELAKQAHGWDPTTVSRGSKQIKTWICDIGHIWIAAVVDRVNGNNCPTCSHSGYDPNSDGYLYFLEHPIWEMLQIGITNFLDDRLGKHKRSGWEVLELRGPMDGHLTQQWETAMLRMLKAKGADLSNGKIAGKFDGYSEAWSKSTFGARSIKELMRLTEEFEDENSKGDDGVSWRQ